MERKANRFCQVLEQNFIDFFNACNPISPPNSAVTVLGRTIDPLKNIWFEQNNKFYCNFFSENRNTAVNYIQELSKELRRLFKNTINELAEKEIEKFAELIVLIILESLSSCNSGAFLKTMLENRKNFVFYLLNAELFMYPKIMLQNGNSNVGNCGNWGNTWFLFWEMRNIKFSSLKRSWQDIFDVNFWKNYLEIHNQEEITKQNQFVELNVGICYEMGLGTEKDSKIALEWYMKSSQKGNPAALNRIALLSTEENFETQYNIVPFDLFKLASDNKFTPAMRNLAWMYNQGDGIQQDVPKALEIFEKASRLFQNFCFLLFFLSYLSSFFRIGRSGRTMHIRHDFDYFFFL